MLDMTTNAANYSPSSVAKAPIKISILVSDLSGSGAGRWGLDGSRPFLISRALSLAGYQTEIVGLSDGLSTYQNLEQPIRIVQRKRGMGLWRSLQQVINASRGDILYAYKPKPTSFGLALAARKLQQKPLLLDIDDWEMSWYGGDCYKYSFSFRQFGRDFLKPNGALRNPDHPLYLQWLESWVKQADCITTHNTFLQTRFGGQWLPNGKDVHLFNPDHYDSERSRQELGLSNYRVLMFPGAPRPYKGVEDVLKALDILNEPDLKLVIVGGSPYDDYDSKLHRKWGKHLIQLPKTAYHEMPSRIAAAHVLMVPQRDDPATRAQFPLKITDGMAMAKPVLATRVGDITKILGDTGFLVDADAPEAIASTIRHIFENYDAALAKGRQARERCKTEFSIEKMSTILGSIFDSQILKMPIPINP
jgi:glycosyltransferase involved in cell wall biosynthesis